KCSDYPPSSDSTRPEPLPASTPTVTSSNSNTRTAPAWDHDAIDDASRLIARAAALRRLGPYQLQAAIVACHAETNTAGRRRLDPDRRPLRHAAPARFRRP